MNETLKNILSDSEKLELAEWEKKNIGASSDKGTSDWTGWRKHIGPPPWEIESN
jgi:hypothetical protein